MTEKISKFGVDITVGIYPTNNVGHDMTIIKVINEALTSKENSIILASATHDLAISAYLDLRVAIAYLEIEEFIDSVGYNRINFTNGSSITVIAVGVHSERGLRANQLWTSDVKDFYTEEDLAILMSNTSRSTIVEGVYCFESERATNKFR